MYGILAYDRVGSRGTFSQNLGLLIRSTSTTTAAAAAAATTGVLPRALYNNHLANFDSFIIL